MDLLAQRISPQAKPGRQKLFIDREQGQIGLFKCAFLDNQRWILLSVDDHLGPRHPAGANDMGRGDEQSVPEINPVPVQGWTGVRWILTA